MKSVTIYTPIFVTLNDICCKELYMYYCLYFQTASEVKITLLAYLRI
jgi:hypothetical protein